MRGQQLTRVARYNRAVVLDLVRRFGPVSKTDLADRSGLAVSSVLNIIASLSRQGLVRSVRFGPSTGGRPPALIELNPEARYAAGVNLHTSGAEAVLLNLAGDIVGRTSLPIQPGSADDLADSAVEAVEQVLRLAHADPGRLLGAGIGVLDVKADPSLVSRLERKLGLPISLDHSANLCALAEFRHGVGKGFPRDTLAFVYADEAIALGLIVDGKLFRGHEGGAGALGHTVVDVNGPLCACGSFGCLDTLASVRSLIRRAVAHGKLTGAATIDPGPAADWDAVSFAAVTQALEQGDAVLGGLFHQSIAYLSLGVTNVMRLLQPRRVVVGGQLFDEAAAAFDLLQDALGSRSLNGTRCRVLRSEFGAISAPLGAATLVLEEFFGIPEYVMNMEAPSEAGEPAFEDALVWPHQAARSELLATSDIRVLSVGNMHPTVARIPFGEPVTVTVDVTLDRPLTDGDAGIKALLHWDRVAVFGGNWPNPKNSPMHRVDRADSKATYSISLGSLPPGKYEFAAHIIGANDLWVPADAREPNGRLEVLPSRVFAREQVERRHGRKEGKQAEVQAATPTPVTMTDSLTEEM